MTELTDLSGGSHWGANDTSSQQCSQDGVTGAVVQRNGGAEVSTDATALAALPAGHSIARFLKGQDNHLGTYFVGNYTAVASSIVRLAARWYSYHTPTFDFQGENSCTNSKQAEFNNDSRVDYIGGDFHTYNYLAFTPSVDCCVSGPGDSSVASSEMKGKWWRFEAVMTNREGPDYRLQYYGKNVTANEAERELIDLWDNGAVDNLTPPNIMQQIVINNYRETSCAGWIGNSHYMMAGWTTNEGQRIGAAEEVEGGEGGGSAIARGTMAFR